MEMDYRKLCVELFGTDDVDELKCIAETVHKKNARNAGRKRRFTGADVEDMRAMIEDGMTVQDVAKRFQTSRQVISKYLNAKPEQGYTLRMTYMYKQYPCTIIDVDFLNQRIMIQNKTKDILRRAFGVVENPTWHDFEWFLKERCFPATRGNAEALLDTLQLTDYDPLQIVEKTKGRMAEDDMWLKFAYYDREGIPNG